MGFDFSKIKPVKGDSNPIDPIDIFRKVKVTDQNINDLWLAQGDALRKWHDNRKLRDIGVVLNTGAGKTLVGLLMAQSLVNETKGKVLYICSSIQLVEQTADKAKGYGLPITTYFKQEFSNDNFNRCLAPCITTYQAVFHGKSKFFSEDIEAMVFDDAHAAEHIIRDHFSLKIERKTWLALHTKLIALFKEYYQNIGQLGTFEELCSPDLSRYLFVPPFEVHRQYSEIMRLLSEARLTASVDTVFPWEYLRDKIDLCAFIISYNTITITPPFVPIQTLPYFVKNVRHIYLSATLGAPDAFTRTFGKTPDLIIAPETTAGECERLIVFPSALGDDDIMISRNALSERKTLILVPTRARAKKWDGFALLPDKENVTEIVNTFKKEKNNIKLLLAARYDGVDLPGDTCRVMVIDDLPTGIGSLERYMWEKLNLSKTLRSTIASRVIQSFGRISRGMSDHGVVFITGHKLVDWLITPKNQDYLPPFLAKQINLGYRLSNDIKSEKELLDVVASCLNRSEDWIEAYDNYMVNSDSNTTTNIDHELSVDIALSEMQFTTYYWDRNYPLAAKTFLDTLDKAFDMSTNTGAWHALWLGRAYELMGDTNSAKLMYQRSHQVQKNIPPFYRIATEITGIEYSHQIHEVSRQFIVSDEGNITLPKSIHKDLALLDGSGTSKQTEESIRALGQYLGLISSRPDHEFDTGPDVLWLSPNAPALCIEAKTDKKETSKYRKEDIGQMADHLQWVYDNTEAKVVVTLFVGPISPATEFTNPSDKILVANLSEFEKLSKILVAALTDVAKTALPLTITDKVSSIFKTRSLEWPDCLTHIKTFKIKDLS